MTRARRWLVVTAGVLVSAAALLASQQGTGRQGGQQGQAQGQTAPAGSPAQGAQTAAPAPPDDIAMMVSRLELEKFKATLKGLTQFGDRREGTQRNRDAVDWIEAQLKSYGCANIERIKYEPVARAGRGGNAGDAPATAGATGATGAGAAGATGATGAAGAGAAGAGAAGAGAAGQRGGGQGGGQGRGGQAGAPLTPGKSAGQGGSTIFGVRGRTGVNNNATSAGPTKSCASSTAVRRLPAPREEVYCTKVGTTHPEEMYIVGGHMDGIGWGQAANDDGSGTAIVMELARIFSCRTS